MGHATDGLYRRRRKYSSAKRTGRNAAAPASRLHAVAGAFNSGGKMIDPGLGVSPLGLFLLQMKVWFLMYLAPILVGFFGIVCMQVYLRIGSSPALPVWMRFVL